MKTRFDVKRAQSMAQIQDAALALFSENGFDKTTIRMIAQKANIALGLLYNYYSSKEDLLMAIFLKCQEDIRTSLQPDGDNIPGNDVENHIRLTFKILKQNRSFRKLVHGIRLQSSIIKKLEAEMKEETEFIQKKMEENLANAGFSFPALEAKLLFATIDGIAHHYLLHDNYPIDDVANLLILKYRGKQQGF